MKSSKEQHDIAAEMRELLAEIERVLPNVKWELEPGAITKVDPKHEARGYVGEIGDWHFAVVTFSIEDQGFLPGSRGYDGLGRKGGTIIHLTKPLAEKAAKLAEASRAR